MPVEERSGGSAPNPARAASAAFLMVGWLRRAPRGRLLLVFAVGALLGGDWGAAIAAMIDSRRDSLSRPGELALAGALAVLGGAAACLVVRGRNH